MDNSFAGVTSAVPLRISSVLDALQDQSLSSQEPLIAGTNHSATIPHAAPCAATLSDESEFPGAPLYTFSESEYKTLLQVLPVYTELPGPKGSFPPLDTWEDMCAEMNYLCGRLGITCTLSAS